MTSLSELDGFDFSQGAFYPPTVIAGAGIEDEIWQEEVFGPVVVVKQFAASYLYNRSPCCELIDACRTKQKASLSLMQASMDSEQGSGPKTSLERIVFLRRSSRDFAG